MVKRWVFEGDSIELLRLSELKDSPPPPPPTIKVSVDKTKVTVGETVRISWTSTNATSAQLTFDDAVYSGLQGFVDHQQQVTTTYVGTAKGEGGSASHSVTVTVVPTPPPPPPPPTEPFDVELTPDHFARGSGSNVDSIAFWRDLMFVTSKGGELIQIFRQPFAAEERTLPIDGRANGVAVDGDELFVGVASNGPRVEVYSLPELRLLKTIGRGTIRGGETNLDVLQLTIGGNRRVYVSDDTPRVLGFDVVSGEQLVEIRLPFDNVETVLCDEHWQRVVIPDEDGRDGVHVFSPDGQPMFDFGAGEFESDAEGITLYDAGGGDGMYIVSDQRSSQTDFECFDRRSGKHLGRFRLKGVSNTDGCALHQVSTSLYPDGVFGAINDDTDTAVISWRRVLDAIGKKPPEPEMPMLTARSDKTSIEAGQTAKLFWETERADSVSLNGVSVEASGEREVMPAETTDYVFVAWSEVGSVTTTVRIVVGTTPPPPPPPPPSGKGVWISRERLMTLPTDGSAWNGVVTNAERSWASVDFSNTHFNHDVYCLAGAMMAARTGDSAMMNKVRSGLRDAMASSKTTLRKVHQLARPLYGYIIAADLIGYRPPEFLQWVREMCEVKIPGHTGTEGIRETARKIPNNHGTAAHAALTAAAIFLGDDEYKTESIDAHREYVGEAVPERLMRYKDTTWHADPHDKAGINRKGSQRDGHSIDGVLPEELRRGNFDFTWPPKGGDDRTYFFTGIEPVIVAGVILHENNLLDWNVGDRAIERAYRWAYEEANWPATGDDTWQPWVVNYYSGTNFPTTSPTKAGKGAGYTDFTHAKRVDWRQFSGNCETI